MSALPVPPPAGTGAGGRRRLAARAALGASAWAGSVAAAAVVEASPEVHGAALAAHILALVVAFGTILVVDWLGLLWLLGRATVHEPGRVGAVARPLIWGGLGLLLASGVFLRPDLSSPVTAVKLVCVLALILNGLLIETTMEEFTALPGSTRFSGLAGRLRARLLVLLSVSQASWWTCVLIGLANSTLRRWGG